MVGPVTDGGACYRWWGLLQMVGPVIDGGDPSVCGNPFSVWGLVRPQWKPVPVGLPRCFLIKNNSPFIRFTGNRGRGLKCFPE